MGNVDQNITPLGDTISKLWNLSSEEFHNDYRFIVKYIRVDRATGNTMFMQNSVKIFDAIQHSSKNTVAIGMIEAPGWGQGLYSAYKYHDPYGGFICCHYTGFSFAGYLRDGNYSYSSL